MEDSAQVCELPNAANVDQIHLLLSLLPCTVVLGGGGSLQMNLVRIMKEERKLMLSAGNTVFNIENLQTN